ncbi:MAG: bud neck involved protein [Pleopsidium flavum]|nr:MAG: bud neck involved protein [Pleopsidium flavum]
MAALVQSFPQHSSTVTMLQTRPSSSSGTFQTGSQIQPHQQSSRSSQMSRNVYNATVGGMGTSSYRGHTSLAPVAPYAFTSTPILSNGGNALRQNPITPHLRQENRTSSAPVIPNSVTPGQIVTASRQRYPASASICTSSSSSSSNAATTVQQTASRDDSSLPTMPRSGEVAPRPASTINLITTTPILPPPTLASSAKPSPDRYRRVQRRTEANTPITSIQQPGLHGGSAFPSGSGMATVGHLYQHPSQSSSSPSLSTYQPYRRSPSPLGSHAAGFSTASQPGQGGISSADDTNLYRQSTLEQAKRSRRRSIASLEAGDISSAVDKSHGQAKSVSRLGSTVDTNAFRQDQKGMLGPPSTSLSGSAHRRNGSAESGTSSYAGSQPSSAKRETSMGFTSPNTTTLQSIPVSKNEAKLVNIPPRGASDPNKRFTNSSPLSHPMTMSPQSPSFKKSVEASNQTKPAEVPALTANNPSPGGPESPAAQHLAALNKKDGKKEGKSSRLRRAFSFGSAAELRRASAENNLNNNMSAERAKLRKERYYDEHEAEQAAIAEKQEAAGLGEGIYSGQGHFFTGSTDNLSISSTASSASVMIRKMGKGMKKSTRSLVGLFRPKSVVGVPAADPAAPEPSVAQVSMVTVEAEREKVNVNLDPHDQVGGGTGFPKLERNSLDAANVTRSDQLLSSDDRPSSENAHPRRSIVGGEKERAEVLAAVKKGILKRSGTDSGNSSPVTRPVDTRTADFHLPSIPHVNDTPGSSAPSTPGDDHQPRTGHRRTDSVTIEGEDYFMSIAKFASGDSKSLPGTPRSIVSRNISFSPRIQFHDTWPSGEYDRRGEIATCNRLTPMLAQQIKEELNTFKMEMEVHEQSKVYTHFF